jgi:hypothetical protein
VLECANPHNRVHVYWFRGFREWVYSTRLKVLS